MTNAAELKAIAIHGVPRSGTTWVGEILNSSPGTVYKFQPLFSYALKDYLGPDSSPGRIREFLGLLADTEDDFLDQRQQRLRGSLPSFEKGPATHIVYKEVRYHHILDNLLHNAPLLRLVAVVRNPLSVIASWAAAPREFRSDLGWKLDLEWRRAERKNRARPEEFFGFEKWKEAARIFSDLEKEFPDRVHALRYETLVESPERAVNALFDFCGLEVTAQTEEFIDRSTRRDVPGEYSVFRSQPTGEKWKSVLCSDIVDAIVRETRAAGLGRYLENSRAAP